MRVQVVCQGSWGWGEIGNGAKRPGCLVLSTVPAFWGDGPSERGLPGINLTCAADQPTAGSQLRKEKWEQRLHRACGRLPNPGTAGREACLEEITTAFQSLRLICRVTMFKVHTLSSVLVPLSCHNKNTINWVAAKQQTFLFHNSEVGSLRSWCWCYRFDVW